MEIESLFGLPAHPLVVHAAVVLVPLAALGVLLVAFWPSMRRRLAIPVAVVALLGFIAAALAQQSGESLEEQVKRTELLRDHTSMGEMGTFAAGCVLAAAMAVAGWDWYARRRRDRAEEGADSPSWLRTVTIAVGVVAVALVAYGTTEIVRIGHSGARATWESVGESEDD